jgi:putative hydrolase of HD superfamily
LVMSLEPEPDARSLLQFFIMSGRLKTERRRGWVKKLKLEHPESVADHSFRTALLAMVISDLRGLDSGKAVRLALLHDLPEAIVGDAMPEERSGAGKIDSETRAMKEMVSELPKEIRARYIQAWEEYVEGESAESRLVHQLDKLEMAIQAWEYANGLGEPSQAKEFWTSAKAHLRDEELIELLKQVEP